MDISHLLITPTLVLKNYICNIKNNSHISIMPIEQINDADFQLNVIDESNNQPVLVDFWAECAVLVKHWNQFRKYSH